MLQVVERLGCLRLDVLDIHWVQGIYFSEFLEFGDFPDEYQVILESLDVEKTFRLIIRAIDEWIDSGESEDDKTWAALSNHVPHQNLLAILGYYIDYGTKNVTNKEAWNNALLASRVYYKFISVPGYKAYHIYHSQLFAHSLACLGFPKAMCDNDDKYRNTKVLTNEVNSVIQELGHFVLDLRSIMEPLQLSPKDMNFADILSNLVDITGGAIVNRLNVDKIELSKISQVIYEIIDLLLCDMERQPNRLAIERLFKCIHPKLITASTASKLAHNNIVRASYVTYSGLILSKYGKAAINAYIKLLQHLCFSLEGLEKNEVRHARMSLVLGLMSLLPQKSYRIFVKWILKLSTVTKITHRQLALEMMYKLLCNEPEEENPRPTEPVPDTPDQPADIEMSVATNDNQAMTSTGYNNEGKPSGISNENHGCVPQSDTSVPNYVTMTSSQNPDDAAKLGKAANTSKKKATESETETQANVGNHPMIDDLMLGLPDLDDTTFNDTVEEWPDLGEITKELSGSDETPQKITDAGKINPTNVDEAIAEIKESANVDDGKPVPKPTDTTNKTPNNTTPVEVLPVIPPVVDDENSQDSQDTQDSEMTEEDVAGLLSARAHTVPHGEVLRALYARVNDSATTIRARAFHVLADCLVGENAPHYEAMRDLNGEGPVTRLMAAAARGVCDDRAVVRRAASGLVYRSLALPSSPMPTTDDLAILVGLCRDASIIVRTAAIGYLGDMAMQRPCDAVFDAWTSGPMHQLNDPENKIQEQVMNLTQQMLIERLQKLTAGGAGNEDPIPWMFLDAITRHNMREYLQRACLLLAKSATGINTRLVDISSTHLGASDATRDLHCLVLLTSVARHVDYSNVEFAIDYYYKLVDDNKLVDTEPRLMPLTLELLIAWTRWMKPASRAALRDHVVGRIAAQDNGCRLQAVSLAAHLDPTNLIWASELMQLCQQRAVSGKELDEWLRAVDLSLVAPESPSPNLVKLFLNALINPPKEWSDEQRGICVAGCGRLCIRSRDNAVAFAPHLAALLRDKTVPLPPRHNAVLILADICTRYTCIVEPLMDYVCACLNVDSEPIIRRAAVRSITKLLLSGYLRLRTPLYYRYCALLADEDHEVREPAEYYVTCSLPLDTICHHFIDCILHYNADDTENISFDARQLVYDVMLQRMTIVQRLNLQCYIAIQILEHAADMTDEGDGELPASLNAALLDAITILCGPRMKLPKNKQRKDGDAADLDDLQERVTTNIVSHRIKCVVAEVVVPVVIRLNQRFQSRGGQLATYLLKFATDLFNDYEAEIKELMEDDQELMKRIQQFQETFGVLDPSFGNSRNLVTASTNQDPETPRAPRKRPAPRTRRSPKKRALNI